MTDQTNNTRRAFLRSLTLSGVGAVSGVALTSAAQAQNGKTRIWDEETDVLVLGYGGAGAAAAITAHDAGAHVMLLEKQAEDAHTCNTKMCFGVWLTPDNVPDAVAYMNVASRVNVDMDLSRYSAASGSHLNGFSFECQWAFPT